MKVFLDIGAHVGESSDFWLEFYPDFKVICFEPYPNNCQLIRKKGYEVIQKAVWIHGNGLRFYTGLHQSGSVYSTKRTGGLNPNKYIHVDSLDLAKFFRERLKKSDYIVAKLNCEGAEYDLIPHLKRQGLLDWVDRWFVQWHWNKIGISEEKHRYISSMINSEAWHAMTPESFRKNFK